MGYIAVAALGLFIGNMINIFIYPKKQDEPLFAWYAGLLYKKYKAVLLKILMAAAYVLLYRTYGMGTLFISYAVLCAVLAAASMVDIGKRIIPDKLVILGTCMGIILLFFNPELTVLSALLGLTAAGGILWFLSFITKGGLGLGDVKLFACAGIFLGIERTLIAMFSAALMSGLVGLVLVVINVANRKKSMPFAPFILVGTLATVVFLS